MRRILAAVLCILLLLTLSSGAARAATITLRAEAGVASAVVSLGDVADISGGESRERIESLRSIVICSAPAPAATQTLGAMAVVSAIRASGVDSSGLMLAGSPQVTVTRVYDLVPVEELRLAFSAHVAERTGWPPDSFTAKAPRNLQSIPVPVGSRAIKVDTDPGEDFRGSVLARLLLEIDGEPYRELGHRFEVERYVEALVAARKIPRGRRLSASDVEVARIEQSLAGEDSLSSVEEAVGLLAARTIRAGKALRAESLTLPPVVRRGERMTVVLAGNGFQILTTGRALEDGATDDIVRVRLQSRKIVKAVVVDSKTLHMIAQGE